jgi:membrane protease YdiL (CAAX protease family)
MDIKTSPLVQMASEAERPTRWWVSWIIAVALTFLGLIAGELSAQAMLGHPAATSPLHQVDEIFQFGMVAFLLFLWLHYKERRGLSSIGLRGANPLRKLTIGLLIGATMMSLGVLIPVAFGQYALGASEHAKLGMDAAVFLLPLLLIFILQGSTEELVLRGYMLQTAGQQVPASVAIIGTSMIFSAMHRDAEVIPLLNIALYALFACFMALRDGSLWQICGFHAGWNFFQGNIFGLPVSGHPEGTSLWNFGPASGSSDLWTGGAFGVEASLVGTILISILVVVSFLQLRKTQAERAISGS